jgi:hypothetical protein
MLPAHLRMPVIAMNRKQLERELTRLNPPKTIKQIDHSCEKKLG